MFHEYTIPTWDQELRRSSKLLKRRLRSVPSPAITATKPALGKMAPHLGAIGEIDPDTIVSVCMTRQEVVQRGFGNVVVPEEKSFSVNRSGAFHTYTIRILKDYSDYLLG